MSQSDTPTQLKDVKCEPLLSEWKEEFKKIRHDFHQHPEIGLETPRTSKIIADLLRQYGVDEVHENIGGYGVVGVITGSEDNGKAVGLRADIDALPLEELNKHDHVSLVKGKMHACGHDGHGATLLSVAKYLAKTRNFKGKAILIFQPGEEGCAGAKHMIDDGLFKRFPVDEVYAFHNSSLIPLGQIGVNNGAMQASADLISITINGKGGHGSRPHMNRDPIVAAAQVILGLQTIVSRNVSPMDTAVISICHVHAGDTLAPSVTPESCQLTGTVRTFDPAVRDLVERRITEVCEGIAKALDCDAKVNYTRLYPPCINTAEQAQAVGDIAAEVIGEENVDREYPRMTGGEDFAFMLQEAPGAYFRVGQRGASAHTPYFDFDDDIIPVAGTIMAHIVEKRLDALDKKANS